MIYKQLTKHRKRCCQCSKLIKDGELVAMRKHQTQSYYPVKGIMGFKNTQFIHSNCLDQSSQLFDLTEWQH